MKYKSNDTPVKKRERKYVSKIDKVMEMLKKQKKNDKWGLLSWNYFRMELLLFSASLFLYAILLLTSSANPIGSSSSATLNTITS